MVRGILLAIGDSLLNPSRCTVECHLGQVVHTHLPLLSILSTYFLWVKLMTIVSRMRMHCSGFGFFCVFIFFREWRWRSWVYTFVAVACCRPLKHRSSSVRKCLVLRCTVEYGGISEQQCCDELRLHGAAWLGWRPGFPRGKFTHTHTHTHSQHWCGHSFERHVSKMSVFRKHLKTHLVSHFFHESPAVPVQWFCHFGHYSICFHLLFLFFSLFLMAKSQMYCNGMVIVSIITFSGWKKTLPDSDGRNATLLMTPLLFRLLRTDCPWCGWETSWVPQTFINWTKIAHHTHGYRSLHLASSSPPPGLGSTEM